MPIFCSHPIDQWFISGDPLICEMVAELFDKERRFLRRESNAVFERAYRSSDDLVRPSREIQPWVFAQPEDRVPKRRLHQDAGVQNYEKSRPSLVFSPGEDDPVMYRPPSPRGPCC